MSSAATAEFRIEEKWAQVAAIGLVTGLLSGLLGIGGAAILVPGMVDILGISQHRATGTSLFVIIPTAAVSAVIYALNAQMNWGLVALFSATAVVGALLGARAMMLVSPLVLRRAFGIFLILVAIRLIVPGGTADTGIGSETDILGQPLPLTAGEGLLGLIAGFLSGFLGIGGGQVLTPGMAFLFGIPQKLAQGISIAFIVPTAISGAIAHYRRGNVLPRVGLLLIPASVVGGVIGSWAVQYVPATTLRAGFGIFLVYGSLRMLFPVQLSQALRRIGGRAT